MKYLKIANKGEIEKEALTLLGGTTKRGDSTKIGMFGSGNKYALAYLLRNGFEIKIYSGVNELKVGTVEKKLRDAKFDVITIDGQETSITTESGPQWKFWYAVREIYSNALDEGLIEMNETPEIMPFEGETHFYIGWNEQVQDFFQNFDKYFSRKKTPIKSSDYGMIYPVVDESELVVYRKGIRCHIEKVPCLFYYNFDKIVINESRVIAYRNEMIEKIQRLVLSCDESYVVDAFYSCAGNSNFIEQEDAGSLRRPKPGHINEAFLKRMPKKFLISPSQTLLLDQDELSECHIVQQWFFDAMFDRFGEKVAHPAFRTKTKRTGADFREIQASDKIRAYIKVLFDFFKEVGYEFNRTIKIVKFNGKKTSDVDHDIILLSEEVFDKGRSHMIKQVVYLDMAIKAREQESNANTILVEALVNYMAEQNSYLF